MNSASLQVQHAGTLFSIDSTQRNGIKRLPDLLLEETWPARVVNFSRQEILPQRPLQQTQWCGNSHVVGELLPRFYQRALVMVCPSPLSALGGDQLTGPLP